THTVPIPPTAERVARSTTPGPGAVPRPRVSSSRGTSASHARHSDGRRDAPTSPHAGPLRAHRRQRPRRTRPCPTPPSPDPAQSRPTAHSGIGLRRGTWVVSATARRMRRLLHHHVPRSLRHELGQQPGAHQPAGRSLTIPPCRIYGACPNRELGSEADQFLPHL